jgi:DNA-binding NtrC family response regulator
MKEIFKYPNYFITVCGRVYSGKTDKYLKPSYDKQGYERVGLYNNGKTTTIKVHRLVAEAYIENPLNKSDVNHKDGDKSNNRLENLEWCTRSENIKHAFKNGLKKIPKHQEERFLKMVKSNTGSKNPAARKVINTKTGEIYGTVNEAADFLGMKRTTLISQLKGINKNKTNFKYYV